MTINPTRPSPPKAASKTKRPDKTVDDLMLDRGFMQTSRAIAAIVVASACVIVPLDYAIFVFHDHWSDYFDGAKALQGEAVAKVEMAQAKAADLKAAATAAQSRVNSLVATDAKAHTMAMDGYACLGGQKNKCSHP